MSKIHFRSKQSRTEQSKLRTLAIIIACIIGLIFLSTIILFSVIWFKSRPQGKPSLIGTYEARGQIEYIVHEYSDYFSDSLTHTLEECSPTSEDIVGLYELYNAYGRKIDEFCGNWDGKTDPEIFRAEQLEAFQARYLYSDENMEKVQFFLYLPAESYRFRVTGAEVGEESLSVTVEVLPDEGEAQTYTLTGTYQMDGNTGTAAYAQTELPPAILEYLQTFQYRSTVNDSNVYVNSLTFSRQITLSR